MASTMRVSVPPTTGGDLASRSFLAHQPEALAAFNHLYGVLWSRGVVDQATKEVARIRNARVTDCGICRSLRFDGARREGLTEEKVERIRDGYLESDLEPRHKTVLRYTDAFLMTPGPPSRSCVASSPRTSRRSRSWSSPPGSPSSWASRRSPSPWVRFRRGSR